MGANGVEDVIIPIKFEVEDNNNVTKYVNTLKKDLERAQKYLSSGVGKGLDNSAEIQTSINTMHDYIDVIEASRASLLKLKDAQDVAQLKLSNAKLLTPSGDVTQKMIDDTVVKAQKDYNQAQQEYLDKSPAFINDIRVTSSLAEGLSSTLNNMTGNVDAFANSTKTAEPKIMSFNQLLHSTDFSAWSKRLDAVAAERKYNIQEIEQEIERLNQAFAYAQNSLEAKTKGPGGKMVSVDPSTTDELQKQYNIVDEYGQRAEELRLAFESFKAMIKDGTIDEEIKKAGGDTEQFKNMLNLLKEDAENTIKTLMPALSAYEKELRLVAATATKVQNGVVTESKGSVNNAKNIAAENAELREQTKIQQDIAKVEGHGHRASHVFAKINALNEENKALEENKAAAEQASKAAVEGNKKESDAVKQTAAQYYYKLRAMKMLGFVLTNIDNAYNKFTKTMVTGATKALSAYSRLIPGVNALRKALDKTHSSQKRLNREIKSTGKSVGLANVSLGKFVLNLVKAMVGVRSIYMLFRKLRKAIAEGFNSMAVQLDDVNAQLSSIVTNFNYMKASITAVVQPLLNALAPALETVANAFEQAAFYASSFIAILTGQNYVYRAVKVQTDYAESLDKTAKSAKDAAKELGKYDKLNVIKKDNDSDNTGGMQWEKVPIDDTIKDWAEKFKNFFKDLFEPLKNAWDKVKGYVIKSWKEAVTQLKLLFKDMAEDFWKVWKEAETQDIFENLLVVLADIGQIVANLAHNFREAWNENDNGYRILESIRDVILIISEGLKDAADYTVKWSSELSFVEVLNALADNMEQKLVPAVEKVKDLFVVLYEQAILKILKDFIESGLPQLVDLFGTLVETVGIIAEKIREAWQSGSNGIAIINSVEALLQIVMDKIKECADKTKEWAEHLNLAPLLSTIKEFLDNIQPAIQFISDTFGAFWTDVLLPFYKYLLEGGENKDGGFVGTLSRLGEVVQSADWLSITQNMHNLFDALEPFFELAWDTLSRIVEDLVQKVLEFAGSDELGTIIDKFKDWVENADPEELATKIETLTWRLIELKAALDLTSKVIMPFVTNWMTIHNTLNNFAASSVFTKIVGAIKGAVSSIAGEAKTFGYVMQDFSKVMEGASKPGGVFAILIGVFEALSNGFDMMENGFSLAGEAGTIFGGVLVAVGAILAGVAAWPAVIAGALVAIIANLGAFGDDIWKFMTETAKEIGDRIGDFFFNLGHNLGKLIGQLISNLTDSLKSKLELMSKPENWLEFGLNILKGILGIFLAPFRLLEWIGKAIMGFVAGFIDGLMEGFDMHSPSKKMEPYGEMILKGLLNGILAVVKTIGTWLKTNVVDPIFNVYKKYFTLQALKDNGTKFITGLQNAIKTGISKLVSYLPNSIKNIISKFKEKLTSSTLISVGKNLLSGLKEGIEEGLSKLLGTVKNVGTTVIDTFKDIFDINSPSKVTEQMGEYLMQGLDKGVEEESDDDLIPTNFTESFLDSLTDMKSTALDIVTSMIDEISEKMENLEFMENFSAQISKISTIKVPDIAVGKVLPSNVEFSQSSNRLDEKTLDKVIRNAISDILSELNTDSNREPIMLQLDKRVVAEAVWDEEEKRYKQRGTR